MRILFTLTLLGALVALPAESAVFDGNRKGFLLDLGLGGGFQSTSQEWDLFGETLETDDSGGGVAVNFKIGYGFNNKLILTYTSNGVSSSSEDAVGDSYTSTFSVGGIGLTYFLKESAPSLFFDATLGFSSWDNGEGGLSGGGFAAGAGYEFRKNWLVSADLGFGAPSDEQELFGDTIKVDSTGLTIGVNVSHIWY
jgi:hypothetical protein